MPLNVPVGYSDGKGYDVEGSGDAWDETTDKDNSRHHERYRAVTIPVVGREESEEEGSDDR